MLVLNIKQQKHAHKKIVIGLKWKQAVKLKISNAIYSYDDNQAGCNQFNSCSYDGDTESCKENDNEENCATINEKTHCQEPVCRWVTTHGCKKKQ